jgi:hypothetical protein
LLAGALLISLAFSSGRANSERGGFVNYNDRYNHVNNRYYHTYALYQGGKSSKLWESKRHCDDPGNAAGENKLSD